MWSGCSTGRTSGGAALHYAREMAAEGPGDVQDAAVAALVTRLAENQDVGPDLPPEEC